MVVSASELQKAEISHAGSGLVWSEALVRGLVRNFQSLEQATK